MDSASKRVIPKDEALNLLKDVDEVYASRGKTKFYFNLKSGEYNQEELEKAILGPTGNFRAPSVKVGRKLSVGFNAENINEVLNL